MTGYPHRKIIHIDMDAFYASVEQRDNPDLRGKPVAVGSARSRGVVAAASYEARKFGVRSAMASVTALRKCPDLIFVRHRFDVYRSISQEIRKIFADYTSLIEPLSLDEAYLDVTENLRGLATATATAREIRDRILQQTGLTASAGISYNKFLAKLASDFRKPNGQHLVPPGKGEDFVAELAIGKFHGIGPVTARKMNDLGIFKGADLRQKSMAFLEEHFGNGATWFYNVSRGEDQRPVHADRIRKSSGSETTFHEDLTELSAVETGITAMADEVWQWCQEANSFGRTVTVKIKYADFHQVTRSKTMMSPVDNHDDLREISRELVRTVFPLQIAIRLLGVTVSNFEPKLTKAAEQLAFCLAQTTH